MSAADFDRIRERWLAEPFPAGSTDDAVDELHAQLAYADSMIADAVLGAPACGHPEPRHPAPGDPAAAVPPQVRAELTTILATARRWIDDPNDARASVAATYRDYAELLLALLDTLPA